MMRAPTASVILRPATQSNLFSLHFHSRFSLLLPCASKVIKNVAKSRNSFVKLTRLQHQWDKYPRRISGKIMFSLLNFKNCTENLRTIKIFLMNYNVELLTLVELTFRSSQCKGHKLNGINFLSAPQNFCTSNSIFKSYELTAFF
jgi:hypothetical protein